MAQLKAPPRISYNLEEPIEYGWGVATQDGLEKDNSYKNMPALLKRSAYMYLGVKNKRHDTLQSLSLISHREEPSPSYLALSIYLYVPIYLLYGRIIDATSECNALILVEVRDPGPLFRDSLTIQYKYHRD